MLIKIIYFNTFH